MTEVVASIGNAGEIAEFAVDWPELNKTISEKIADRVTIGGKFSSGETMVCAF